MQKKLYLALIKKTQEELNTENKNKVKKEASIVKFVRENKGKNSVNFYKENYGDVRNRPCLTEPELKFIDETTVFRTSVFPKAAK